MRVAVVTGSDRGIGFETVKGLSSKIDGLVYLTSIKDEDGLEALKKLESEGFTNVRHHQLDITDLQSIQRLVDHLKETYGGLDVLVNNAAISFKIEDRTTPELVKAVETIKVNFTGTLNMMRTLTPILKPHARVVNLASMLSLARNISNDDIVKRIGSDEAVEADVIDMVNDYVCAVREGNFIERGYPSTTLAAYTVAKIGITALTRIYQRETKGQRPNDDILFNACCPGMCRTAMSDFVGQKSAQEGSITPIFLATIEPNDKYGPQGEFWSELKPFDWFTRRYQYMPPEFQ